MQHVKKEAHNECVDCNYDWWDWPGTLAAAWQKGCPACGSRYWLWLNFGGA